MTIELARTVIGDESANSTEFDHSTPHPVIDLMPEQRDIADMGGTMRLGTYPCALVPGTRAQAAYGSAHTDERHRHRFEFNNAYRGLLAKNGLVLSGLSPDGRLVEIAELPITRSWSARNSIPNSERPNRPHPLFKAFVEAAAARLDQVADGQSSLRDMGQNLPRDAEIADHPFMVGSQFHPEFKSRPNRPAPIVQGVCRSGSCAAGSSRMTASLVFSDIACQFL